MQQYFLMRSVDRVSQVFRALWCHVRRVSAEISPRPYQQLRALMAIRDEDIHTQAALAERLLIDPPAASRLVDRLVEDGLVERCAGADRRCVRLAVTRAADDEIALAEQILDQVEADMLRHLTAAEARTLRTLLAKVGDGLSASTDDPDA